MAARGLNIPQEVQKILSPASGNVTLAPATGSIVLDAPTTAPALNLNGSDLGNWLTGLESLLATRAPADVIGPLAVDENGIVTFPPVSLLGVTRQMVMTPAYLGLLDEDEVPVVYIDRTGVFTPYLSLNGQNLADLLLAKANTGHTHPASAIDSVPAGLLKGGVGGQIETASAGTDYPTVASVTAAASAAAAAQATANTAQATATGKIAKVAGPSAGNFPVLTAGGELSSSTCNAASFLSSGQAGTLTTLTLTEGGGNAWLYAVNGTLTVDGAGCVEASGGFFVSGEPLATESYASGTAASTAQSYVSYYAIAKITSPTVGVLPAVNATGDLDQTTIPAAQFLWDTNTTKNAAPASYTLNLANVAAVHLSCTWASNGTLTLANPTGTPTNGRRILYRIKNSASSAGAVALAWGNLFRGGSDVALPSTLANAKTLYVGAVYNDTDSKWDVIAAVGGL